MRKRECGCLKGYLTIYISLTMTVMLSLCLTLIEGVRRNTIRMEAECVMDIALNSILAEYHKELFVQYNLFYIDSSYGSTYPSYYNTEARLRFYLEQNLDIEEVAYFDFLYKDLLEMELGSAYLKRVALATDGDGLLFQKKAAEAILDDTGLKLAENVLSWVQTIESQGMLTQDMEAKKQAADAQLEAYNGTEKQLTEETWITVEIANPTQHLNEMRGQGVLKWVLDSEEKLSGQKVDLNQYISARRRRAELNQGNAQTSGELSVVERILFQEYMLRYAGHYGQEKEGSLLQYQTEYLIAGKAEDAENLRQVAATICGIREVANASYLYGDTGKMTLVKTVAATLAGLTLCPELEPLFETTLVLGWAYLESLYDTKLLLAGGKVPLLKDTSTWHYDLDSILQTVDMQLGSFYNHGMSYTDYLHVLLYMTDLEKTTFRFMDLMEMDIRLTEGNEAFRMDACIESVEAEVVIQSGYGYRYSINREKSYQ